MSAYPKRLLSIQNLSTSQAKKIIQLAISLKKKVAGGVDVGADLPVPKVAALIFLEPSTRTSMSFEMAAHRLGVRVSTFTPHMFTSVVKGESAHETLENILAMQPDVAVVRHSGDAAVTRALQAAAVPVINAGDGTNEHPTQALLDAMTIVEKRGQVESEKIVFVGDVEHSRVARSGHMLFTLLGAQVAVCAPEHLQPKSKDWADVKFFSSLSEATTWASVCMGLRVQKERHATTMRIPMSAEQYVQKFRIDKKNTAKLSRDALIMHPGPFVAEEDLSEEILSDPRCVIHQQVTNGVYIRMTVLGQMLGVLP